MSRRLLALVSIALLFLPANIVAQNKRLRKYIIVPAWKIQIVDQAGNPIKGALVRQIWQDYDVEEENHRQDAYSDEKGFVSFPERTITTSPEERAKGCAKNIRELGVHASCGDDAYILSWTDDPEGDVYYEVGKPLPTRLVMRPRDLPKGGI